MDEREARRISEHMAKDHKFWSELSESAQTRGGRFLARLMGRYTRGSVAHFDEVAAMKARQTEK